MSQIFYLNLFKKQKIRSEKDNCATESSVRFGRNKGQWDTEKRECTSDELRLDDLKRGA
jgi:hypothetical protein